jgi:acetoin utilization protein AcuB
VIVLLIREIMTRGVVTASPDTRLAEGRRLLDEHRIRHLPVVVDGRLAGIVSDRDLRSAGASGRPTAVGEIMTPDPITVGPDTRVEEAAHLMLDRRLGGLPVVDDGELIGIVTSDDLLRALLGVIETATLERISVELAGPRDA